jgi:hypothetical protein
VAEEVDSGEDIVVVVPVLVVCAVAAVPVGLGGGSGEILVSIGGEDERVAGMDERIRRDAPGFFPQTD